MPTFWLVAAHGRSTAVQRGSGAEQERRTPHAGPLGLGHPDAMETASGLHSTLIAIDVEERVRARGLSGGWATAVPSRQQAAATSR